MEKRPKITAPILYWSYITDIIKGIARIACLVSMNSSAWGSSLIFRVLYLNERVEPISVKLIILKKVPSINPLQMSRNSVKRKIKPVAAEMTIALEQYFI